MYLKTLQHTKIEEIFHNLIHTLWMNWINLVIDNIPIERTRYTISRAISLSIRMYNYVDRHDQYDKSIYIVIDAYVRTFHRLTCLHELGLSVSLI